MAGLIKRSSFALLITCVSLTNAHADEPFWAKYIPNFIRQYIPGLASEKGTTVFGPASYNNVTLATLEVMGPATIVDVKVEGQTNIQGPFDARDSKLNSLEVNGPVSLQGTTVTGQTIVNGPLSLDKKSTLEDLTIAANEMKIKDSIVNNITVRKGDDKSKKQVITLEGTSRVKGSIKFEQEGGQVVLRDASKVDGLITGGENINNHHKKPI
ncbi:MAG: hypothetical protein K2W94_09075 [Alphaproteobacteria bacterium]|nr:hypothetical protein [Alphaproteobacteria bacterium]